MKNRKKSFGILAKTFVLGTLFTAAIFVTTATGCINDLTYHNGDLNGTWVYDSNPAYVYIFNNGNFELRNKMKGVYTVSGDIITMTVIHSYSNGVWIEVIGKSTSKSRYSIIGNTLTFIDWKETYTKQ